MQKYIIKNQCRKAFNPFLIFWLFIIGSVIGFVFEGILSLVRNSCWENHSALVWGPFCVVYGIGAVSIYLLAIFLEDKNILIKFLSYFTAGAIVEYTTSLLQEIFFKSVSWDYSTHFLNISGRVSLKMAFTWGVFGMIFIKLIYPLINRFHVKNPPQIMSIITWICFVFMIINIIISSVAVVRWNERHNGDTSQNHSALIHMIDKYFNDDYMKFQYTNMKFISK